MTFKFSDDDRTKILAILSSELLTDKQRDIHSTGRQRDKRRAKLLCRTSAAASDESHEGEMRNAHENCDFVPSLEFSTVLESEGYNSVYVFMSELEYQAHLLQLREIESLKRTKGRQRGRPRQTAREEFAAWLASALDTVLGIRPTAARNQVYSQLLEQVLVSARIKRKPSVDKTSQPWHLAKAGLERAGMYWPRQSILFDYVQCGRCLSEVWVPISYSPTEEQFVGYLESHGWRSANDQLICPECCCKKGRPKSHKAMK